MLFRDLQHAAHRMDQIDTPLRQGILGDSPEQMAERAAQAEVVATQLISRLQEALHDNADALEAQTSDGRDERNFVRGAVKALQEAAMHAQGVLPGGDVSALRATLLDVKAQADIATIYLRVAIGQKPT